MLALRPLNLGLFFHRLECHLAALIYVIRLPRSYRRAGRVKGKESYTPSWKKSAINVMERR